MKKDKRIAILGEKMSREEILTKLNEVFQNIYDDEEIVVNDATTVANIEDGDSLEHIRLVVAIEEKFHIKFSMSEVVNMKSVGAIVNIILQRTQ